jgi:hypothetical protein
MPRVNATVIPVAARTQKRLRAFSKTMANTAYRDNYPSYLRLLSLANRRKISR